MNKKALGALAATGVLIAFSLLLGWGFMYWGKGYIAQRAEFVVGVAGDKAGCVNLDLRFIEINRIPQICHAGGVLRLLVENVGNTVVSQLQARVVDDEGPHDIKEALSQPIPIGESRSLEINIKPPAKQTKVTPVILKDDKKEICFDKSLSFDGPYPAC